jgi:hypothetical protein
VKKEVMQVIKSGLHGLGMKVLMGISFNCGPSIGFLKTAFV